MSIRLEKQLKVPLASFLCVSSNLSKMSTVLISRYMFLILAALCYCTVVKCQSECEAEFQCWRAQPLAPNDNFIFAAIGMANKILWYSFVSVLFRFREKIPLSVHRRILSDVFDKRGCPAAVHMMARISRGDGSEGYAIRDTGTVIHPDMGFLLLLSPSKMMLLDRQAGMRCVVHPEVLVFFEFTVVILLTDKISVPHSHTLFLRNLILFHLYQCSHLVASSSNRASCS